jgi:hypothetical protein
MCVAFESSYKQFIMVMSMGWDHVSELRQPAGLSFIPQVIYEHGEAWRIDIDMGTFVHQSLLAILANQKQFGKRSYEFSFGSIFVHTYKLF